MKPKSEWYPSSVTEPNFNAPALNLHVPINIDNPFAINNDPAVPNYAEPARFGIINLLSPAECNGFSDELHLLLTQTAVNTVNCQHLSSSRKPVLCSKAQHNCSAGTKASEDDAEGFEQEVLLAEGAKVIMTHNLWIAKGKYLDSNISLISTMVCISILSPGVIQNLTIVTLDPQNPGQDGIDPSWVPIVPSVAQWKNKPGTSLSCTQMPLTPAWARV